MDAWASFGADVPAWELRLSSGYVIVAVDEGEADGANGVDRVDRVEVAVAGFARLEEGSGVIDLLYVDPVWQKHGIGRRLMEKMLARRAR